MGRMVGALSMNQGCVEKEILVVRTFALFVAEFGRCVVRGLHEGKGWFSG